LHQSSLKLFSLPLEARGGEIDFRTNTTSSAYVNVASLAANNSLTAYVGNENKTAEFSRLLEQEREDPKVGISIRWMAWSAGAVKTKLVLAGLLTTAKAIRGNSRLSVDTTPGILIKVLDAGRPYGLDWPQWPNPGAFL
jgi:hypothetical protein